MTDKENSRQREVGLYADLLPAMSRFVDLKQFGKHFGSNN